MTIKIAIDGPAGAGKSTVAKILAKKLNFVYVDTGALYRAITYKILKEGININEKKAILNIMNNFDITLKSERIFLDGIDITEEIRKPYISHNVSQISQIPEIRDFMVKLQKELANKNNIVMDGRDITTVVMPDAQFKFYITATEEIRAKRRYNELKTNNFNISFEDILDEIKIRDKMDMERSIAPLKIAEDAIVVDTSDMTIDEVTNKLYDIIIKQL
ncbi:MAG: (d)CMP kinase [Thermoanaerobacteraceae bacterium]|nr:(d)CMP kinase [Thermoanaerobacteraceae bacterium]